MRHKFDIKKKIRRFAAIVAVIAVLPGFCDVFDADLTQTAYADAPDAMREGDILKLKAGGWEEEFIVLDPSQTNTGKPGMLLLQKDIRENVDFMYFDGNNMDPQYLDDYNASANIWEGSTIQQWCSEYYDKLPGPVKASVIGVKTHETESGYAWAGLNNIDGTRDGSKDKVFLLSVMEYFKHQQAGNMETGVKWYLRSPYNCGDVAAYVVVVDGVDTYQYGTSSYPRATPAIGARPAFNISLPDSISVEPAVSDSSYWIADFDKPARTAAEEQAAGPAVVVDSRLPKLTLGKPGKANKAVTAKWKKLKKSKQKKIQGIEIQYSRDKSFSSDVVAKTVKKNKSSYRIKGLAAKTTYWVRVRTYKTAGNVRYVSKWSKTKKIRRK